MRLTFRPSLLLYGFSLACVVLAVWLFTRPGDVLTMRLPAALALLVVGIPVLLAGWKTYRLDEEGIEVASFFGRRAFRWSDIGVVQGTETAATASFEDHEVGKRGAGLFEARYDVGGLDGRHLFRVNPWTARKRQLVAEIRRRAAAVRKLAAR